MVHCMFASLVPQWCLVLLVSNLAALMRDFRVMLYLRGIFKRRRFDVFHDPFFLSSGFCDQAAFKFREKLKDYNNSIQQLCKQLC